MTNQTETCTSEERRLLDVISQLKVIGLSANDGRAKVEFDRPQSGKPDTMQILDAFSDVVGNPDDQGGNKMTKTPQQHAEAIKEAAQAYYNALDSAENDGLKVSVDAQPQAIIGYPDSYTVEVVVEEPATRWRT